LEGSWENVYFPSNSPLQITAFLLLFNFYFANMNEWILLAMVCAGALFAGFIDAVVGGGGLVQVPLLMIVFPAWMHTNIIATNRFASLAGTMVAARQYIKKIEIDKRLAITMALLAAAASFGGTFVMKLIRPEVFKPILLVVIVVLTAYTFFKKDFGKATDEQPKGKHNYWLGATIALLVGFYNGFIGPGTGVLLLFGMVSILKLDFLQGSAKAKLINFIADAGSMIGFLITKMVVFKIALPMMLCNMLGAYIGSKTAIRKGNGFIRTIFLLVMALLIARLSWEVF
jgi:uncharacterized protein